MFNVRILLLLIIGSILTYLVHILWKKLIDPRRSTGYFLLYMFVHLVSVFLLVFIFAFFINYYREFFIG